MKASSFKHTSQRSVLLAIYYLNKLSMTCCHW